MRRDEFDARVGMPLRRIAGIVALATLGSIVVGCGISLFGDPWGGLDPDAARIVPATGPDAATVATTAEPDSRMPGLEGSVLFIRLTSPDGGIVLDRPFEWPSDEQFVPPGDYTITAYMRGCNGNCEKLSGESPPICEGNVHLGAEDRVVVHVIPRDFKPGTECTISMS